MCELDFVKVGAFIGFTVTLIALCYIMYHYLQGGFKSKDKPIPYGGYNEYNLPKGCKLIQLGDKYMFALGSLGCADLTGEYTQLNTWTAVENVRNYCLTKDKEFAIKRGIETFEFFKALGKI
jgi:hypothetical protein